MLSAMDPHVIIERMIKMHQFAIMFAPTNSQYACSHRRLEKCADEVEEMRQAYNQRRRFLLHEFARMKLECFEPKGAFYMFPNISEFEMTSEEFATRFLMEEKVAVVPGTAFGDCGEGILTNFLRIFTGRSERGYRNLRTVEEKRKSPVGTG